MSDVSSEWFIGAQYFIYWDIPPLVVLNDFYSHQTNMYIWSFDELFALIVYDLHNFLHRNPCKDSSVCLTFLILLHLIHSHIASVMSYYRHLRIRIPFIVASYLSVKSLELRALSLVHPLQIVFDFMSWPYL